MINFLKKSLFFLLSHKKIIIFLLALVLLMWFLFFSKNQKNIATYTVKKGDIAQTIIATGTITSSSIVNLNFLTGGKLTYVGAHEGDYVKKGQIIATLDLSTVEKNLEKALKDYAIQRNKFEEIKKENNDLTPSNALNDEMKRILENNQYDLDKAVISVELQELAKEQSVLTSPIDGIVIRADAEIPGINVSQTATFTIVDPSSLEFEIEVDESDIGKIKNGQKIIINLDAYPQQDISSFIYDIDFASHKTETGGNAYTIKAKLPNEEKIFYRIGMSGDAEIIIDEKKSVITIPISSISDSHVYVKKGDKFEKRKIIIGIQSDVDAEVKNGLEENEIIALQPSEIENKKELIIHE